MHTVTITWQSPVFDDLTVGQLYEILRLRQQVFIIEQDCLYQDVDDLDQRGLHLGGWENGELLAYLRALPPGVSYPESSLGRIVVSPAARGRDLGREVVRRGIELNLATWPGAGITIGAQAHLEVFYQGLGFETVSDVYDEDGIPHITMRYQQ